MMSYWVLGPDDDGARAAADGVVVGDGAHGRDDAVEHALGVVGEFDIGLVD